MTEIISEKTRVELREYFVQTTLAIIKREFSAVGLAPDFNHTADVSGQRRLLVEQYYAPLDWNRWADAMKFTAVYENVLLALENAASDGDDWSQSKFRSLRQLIERDGFSYENGRLLANRRHPAVDSLSEVVTSLELPHLHRLLERLDKSVDEDPALAIGSAKELVESICKTILDERGIAYKKDADIGALVKDARSELGLISDSIPEAAKGAEAIRRLLSNLGNVAQGLGQLRNLYGSGHGRHGAERGLSPQHARLVVEAAAVLATFLLETHHEREQ